MNTTTSALFLIDLQVGNINHLFNSEEVIKANRQVLAKARASNMPIFHFKYHEEQRDIRFGEPWTAAGTPEGEFYPELAPQEQEYSFTKPAYGAFSVSELESHLNRLGIETIWLTGVMSQVCVLATAYEAYARKYQVNVISEAVGATSEKNLELGLGWMRKYVADLKALSDFDETLG